LQIPVSCPDVPAQVLNPRNAWADKQDYDRTAADLAARFAKNFEQFDAPEAVRAAGPKAK
jgi:phosphoenolpyruvate carboxykinase (ATP)